MDAEWRSKPKKNSKPSNLCYRMKEAYLVLDIGTGNVRAALVTPSGEVIKVARDDIRYYRDELYPDAIHFLPEELLGQLKALSAAVLSPEYSVLAVTSTSQREGIVLINTEGKATLGMPNIDHRGREWQENFGDKSEVYRISGRYPTSLFSVYKLIGIRERRPELWQEVQTFLSISDWALWALTGVAVYEHSQASETLIYDVSEGMWSTAMLEKFGISPGILSPLVQSGTAVGKVQADMAAAWGISTDAVGVVGGGDTQLAIKSTKPESGDVILVSGTTTPVVKLESKYLLDEEERTWTSRDIAEDRFVFEANAGVTGLNLQRLKEVFYPNEGYELIEKELNATDPGQCFASLGSLIAYEKTPVIRGGFVFPVPVTHELKRASFVWASLVDIAFSIVENYKVLASCSGHEKTYLWACGGGLQSAALRQLIADISGKEVRVRKGFEQATVIGSAFLCNEALSKLSSAEEGAYDVAVPQQDRSELWVKWSAVRKGFQS
jgi:autoinducer 2 (AI-2) kinase